MILSRVVRCFLAGLLATALVTLTPVGLASPARAAMHHDTLGQSCSSGCVSNSFGQPPAVFEHQSEKEQRKDPARRPEPYYLQFACLYVPQKLTPHASKAVHVLRPPNLVKRYATYRN